MAFITVADTGLISYVSTRNLAERWGFGALSWLYPLCLDAVAAVGMDLWMSHSPAKRAAKWLALFAVALSLAANVVDWLYVGPGAAVLGAVPPLMLAALLLTLHRHGAHTEHTPTPTTEQAPQDHPDTGTMSGQPVGMVVPVPAADSPCAPTSLTLAASLVSPSSLIPCRCRRWPLRRYRCHRRSRRRYPRRVRAGAGGDRSHRCLMMSSWRRCASTSGTTIRSRVGA